MIKILELFGGIGACSKALERLGIDYEIADYVEIDKYAVKSFNAIHNTNFEPQDVCKWDKNIEVDLIMHGSPCQDFSLAGKQAGGDEGSGTRSSLMYETIRIVEKLKPKYVIWENVKNVISKKHKHNYDNYCNKMGELGYKNYGQVLNAKDYGIPQNRERVFTISIRKDIDTGYIFPPKQELKLKLKDMLEDEVDEKYYLSDKMVEYISASNDKWTGNNDKSIINKTIASAINTGEGSRRCDASNYISKEMNENYNLKIKNATKQGYLEATDGDGIDISSRMEYHRGNVQKQMIQTLDTQCTKGVVMNDLRIRKLTPKECWRLMGFDDEDFEKAKKVNSNTQLYKQAGNSIVVNVLEEILKNLLGDKKMRGIGISLEEIQRFFEMLKQSKTNNEMTILITNDMCKELQIIVEDLCRYKEILQERIDNAKKYIVNNSTYKYSKKEYGLNYIKAKDLLTILGEDKNE